MFVRRQVKEATMTKNSITPGQKKRVVRYAREEVQSSCVYPEGYKLKGAMEQANRLRELFPGIGYANEAFAVQPVPAIMEGYFVIPRWDTVAKTYNEAVEKVLAAIASIRSLQDPRKGRLGPERFWQSERTTEMFRKLGDRQKGYDLLIVPAQFGLRHRGRSARRACKVFADNEFGLGAFATGIMLLTHPERLERDEDLWIDCAGDVIAARLVGRPTGYGTPVWIFSGPGLGFFAFNDGITFPNLGSASACLPK
jgi:hypothetical protein